MAILMGLDPGSLHLGYGLIESRGDRLRHLAHGTLSAPRKEQLSRRLAILHEGLCRILDENPPDALAIEKVFTYRNVASALTLGQARGMILLAAGQRELPIVEYSTTAVKKAVTGNGRASKEQVAAMVCRLVSIPVTTEDPDATDALALAVCHAAQRQFEASLRSRIADA